MWKARENIHTLKIYFLSGAGFVLGAVACLGAATTTTAQDGQQGDTSRQIVADEFTNSRPSARRTETGARTNPPVTRQRKTYRRVTPSQRASSPAPPAGNPRRQTSRPNNSSQRNNSSSEIGFTVWRLRRASASDQGARILEHPDAPANAESNAEWLPERVEADTPLAEGDRVRVSIETLRAGYLYVIDREQYADGTMGDPFLIFPTLRTRGGDSRVTAGRVVEIPEQSDTPPYFRMRRSRREQTGEALTVIVTDKPLTELQIGRNPLKLTAEQVARWEREWGAPSERLELNGGAGTAYTSAEQQAGANGSRQLTQDEPLPQTIYRVAARAGNPLLVTLTLRYTQTNAPK